MKISNYIHYKDPEANSNIKRLLRQYIKKYNPKEHNFLIFVCVGSDRITGDALGPLVGYYLKELSNKENIKIVGDLEYPVHGTNIESVMEYVNETFINPFIIAIDSSFGKNEDEEGWIWITDKSLHPGSGLNKKFHGIGNISISGCTASLDEGDETLRFLVLQGARLNLVLVMAELIAKCILEVMENIEIE